VEDAEGIEHDGDGYAHARSEQLIEALCEGRTDEGEETGADLSYAVAKVEQAEREPGEDDAELQPAQEGALVGEEDLRAAR
jgi:hypothetical protein